MAFKAPSLSSYYKTKASPFSFDMSTPTASKPSANSMFTPDIFSTPISSAKTLEEEVAENNSNLALVRASKSKLFNEVSQVDENVWEKLAGKAIAGLLPVALGYAAGGAGGAAAGSQFGVSAISSLDAKEEIDRQKRELKAAGQLEQLRDLEKSYESDAKGLRKEQRGYDNRIQAAGIQAGMKAPDFSAVPGGSALSTPAPTALLNDGIVKGAMPQAGFTMGEDGTASDVSGNSYQVIPGEAGDVTLKPLTNAPTPELAPQAEAKTPQPTAEVGDPNVVNLLSIATNADALGVAGDNKQQGLGQLDASISNNTSKLLESLDIRNANTPQQVTGIEKTLDFVKGKTDAQKALIEMKQKAAALGSLNEAQRTKLISSVAQLQTALTMIKEFDSGNPFRKDVQSPSASFKKGLGNLFSGESPLSAFGEGISRTGPYMAEQSAKDEYGSKEQRVLGMSGQLVGQIVQAITGAQAATQELDRYQKIILPAGNQTPSWLIIKNLENFARLGAASLNNTINTLDILSTQPLSQVNSNSFLNPEQSTTLDSVTRAQQVQARIDAARNQGIK